MGHFKNNASLIKPCTPDTTIQTQEKTAQSKIMQTQFKKLSLILILNMLLAVPASANEGWFGWSFEQNDSWNKSYDRSSAREWEKNPPKGFPTLKKANLSYMKEAIKRYADIVSAGGWPSLPEGKLESGMTDERVKILRKRLEMTGDLEPGANYPSHYNYYVEKAVRRYQIRNGLTPSGIVDRRTRAALNVSASIRLRQLRTNIARMYGLVKAAQKRYVAVNIPAQQIEVVDNEQIVSRHAAVVGKPDRQSPRLQSKIHEINFNPYWNVPQSIVIKDLVPKARSEAKNGRTDLLERFRISALDGKGRVVDPKKINWFSDSVLNYRYRQDPWEDNSMGFVKINFHNQHAVYMHDTPSKSLFGRNVRANSSGCIRVQNVKQLVAWLLKANEGWNRERVNDMEKTRKRLDVRLKQQVPVFFMYITAWATEDGSVQFRRDLYSLDGVGATASAY